MMRAITGLISTLAVIVFVLGASVSIAADIPATPASPRLQTLASDGGSSYWDAICIVERHRFAKTRAPGSPARTVAFHGAA